MYFCRMVVYKYKKQISVDFNFCSNGRAQKKKKKKERGSYI